jgi:hypothetical protein
MNSPIPSINLKQPRRIILLIKMHFPTESSFHLEIIGVGGVVGVDYDATIAVCETSAIVLV